MAQKAFRDTLRRRRERQEEDCHRKHKHFHPFVGTTKLFLKHALLIWEEMRMQWGLHEELISKLPPLSPSFQPLPSDQNQNNNKTRTKPKSRFFLLFRAETKFRRGATSSPCPLPVAEPSSLSGEQPAAPSHGGDGEGQAASSGPGLEVLLEALAEAGSGRPRGSPASSGPPPATPPAAAPGAGMEGGGCTGGAAGIGGNRANWRHL